MPTTAALWSLGAGTLSRAFAAREISPVEIVNAVLDRIEDVNPRLNAIVTLDREGAPRAAAESERRWRDREARGPLDGVPLTVKDNIPVRGMRTTWGSRLFAGHVPHEDELPVARLRAEGMVILGKTNVPEFTLQGYTDNPLFGPTRNPWDARLTPGGSSGGAVAAVAAGLGPVAIATDGGGSIRRPASHTGLFGFKPSPGRVARAHGLPVILHDFEAIGPIARTVADAALVFCAMSGADPHDGASMAFARAEVDTARDPRRLRILFVQHFGGSPVDPEIAASVAAAATNLEELGHTVDQGSVPVDLEALDRIWSVVGPAGLAWLMHGRDLSQISPPIRQMAENGARLTAADYVGALDAVTRMRSILAEFFQSYDLILTPSAAALPWPAETSHPDRIDGTPVGPRGHAVFTAFANAGGLPGASIPCAPAHSGLPIGFQLVGRFGDDEELLRVAAQYERAHPWADRWPPIG
ncbi:MULTISPECIES: amidase [unclassified Ensifer]|uniref:amidase n=1 Tax=unclassified Ensifer TaxID=2633371 RepID=UPI000812C263|nr:MULTISPECIES: amidase [unclassified Ensifer]OCO98864.1 amidase [Ensifer sp. LC14]OCP02638.1 amidase [Ensifer sp. LC11]OCP02972.1 amidase [Ensifer sp. LC13]OCP29903.1 amidase [Ensifer sp. LC499]